MCAAEPGDSVGVAHGRGCLVGELGVLVHDDDQRGHVRGWFPDALSGRGQVPGPCLQDRDRVGEQRGGLVCAGGEPVDARRPRAQFHPVLQVDGPDHHVVTGGEGCHEDVEAAALARPGRAGEQGMPSQERHAALLGVLERPEVDGLGDRAGGRAGPRDRFGVRVGVEDPKFAAVGLAVAGRVEADRAAVGTER